MSPVNLGSAYGKIEIDTSGVTSSLNRAQGEMASFQGKMQSVGASLTGIGKQMTLGITLPLVGIGTAAAKVAMDFESQMAILGIAARASGTAVGDLSKAALAAGADTSLLGITASQAAGAMTTFYKAGMTTNEVFGDLEGYLAGTAEVTGAFRAAVDLAAASDLNLAQASDVVAIAIATFGLNAEEASNSANIFVGAADASVAEVSDLTEALVNVGPTAAAFGWSLGDVNTALALLSERGIRGSDAGTALKSMMTNLMRPTDDVTTTLQALNIELYNTSGQMYSLPEIIGQLAPALAGLSEEERNLAVQTLAGTYGMKAMQTLVAEGVPGWEAMTAAIGEAATAQEVAATRVDTFAGSMEILRGNLETLLITVGQRLIDEFLRPAAERLTEVIDRLNTANPQFLDMAIKIGLVAAAAGPVLLILGTMATALGALLSPIGLVLVAVAGLAAAWATNFGGIRDITQPVLDAVIGGFNDLKAVFEEGGIVAALRALAEGIVGTIQEYIPKIAAQLVEWGAAFVDWIGPKIPEVLTALGGLASGVLVWIGEQVTVLAGKLAEWGTAFLGWVGPQIPPLLTKLGELAQQFFAWIGAQAAPILEKLGAWAKALVDWIVPATVKFIDAWPDMLNKFLDWIGGAAGPILAQLGDWALAFVAWIVPAIPKIVAGLAGISVAILKFIGDTLIVLGARLLTWAEAFVNWIVDEAVPRLAPALGEFLSAITGWVSGAVSKLVEAGRSLLEGLIEGVKSKVGDLIGSVTGAIGDAIQAAKNLLGIGSPSTVFAEIGQAIMVGLAQGIAVGSPEALEALGDALSALGAGMGAIVGGLVDLAGWTGAGDLSGALAAFRNDLIVVIQVMNEIAARFDAELLAATADFSESVGKVTGMFKTAIEGLLALSQYIQLGHQETMWNYVFPGLYAFEADIRGVITLMQALAQEFDTELMQATADFAEAVGKITGMFKTAIEGLQALGEYVQLGHQETMWNYVFPGLYALEADIRGVIAIVSRLALEFNTTLLGNAASFAEGVARVVEAIVTASEGLVTLSEVVIASPALTTWGEQFIEAIRMLFARIDEGRAAIQNEILSAAAEFAQGCLLLLTHITDGINTLSSLPQLALNFYLTGEGLGINFIRGIIDGLVNQASTLYRVIADIVANAIAAANAAAGASSPSTEMIGLGKEMVAGLGIGWGKAFGGIRKEIATSVAMLSTPAMLASPALSYTGQVTPAYAAAPVTGGGGLGGVTVNVKTLEPASVARQVELAMNRLRLQAELDAGRG